MPKVSPEKIRKEKKKQMREICKITKQKSSENIKKQTTIENRKD